MPRTPDPELESRIIAAALRLLDRGGEDAITMRAVAQEAGTTTPTIYERFPDRDARAAAGGPTCHGRAYSTVLAANSTLSKRWLANIFDSAVTHPHALRSDGGDLRRAIGCRGSPPVFELLKSRLTREVGVSGSKCDDLALAIASLFVWHRKGNGRSRHAYRVMPTS